MPSWTNGSSHTRASSCVVAQKQLLTMPTSRPHARARFAAASTTGYASVGSPPSKYTLVTPHAAAWSMTPVSCASVIVWSASGEPHTKQWSHA
jgi:hypothetical protein